MLRYILVGAVAVAVGLMSMSCGEKKDAAKPAADVAADVVQEAPAFADAIAKVREWATAEAAGDAPDGVTGFVFAVDGDKVTATADGKTITATRGATVAYTTDACEEVKAVDAAFATEAGCAE